MGETSLVNRVRLGLSKAIAPRMQSPQREIWPYGDGSYSGYRLRLARSLPELRLDPYGLALAAETSVWANACIQLRKSAVARMPWHIYDAAGNELDNTPFHAMQKYARLAYQQNLFALWEQSLSVHGETYFEKLWNRSLPGLVIPGGLRILNAIAMYPQVISGQIAFYQYHASGGKYKLEVNELFVHRYTSLTDDYRASAPMITAMDAVGIKRNMQNFMRGFFDNDATPGGIVTPKSGVTVGKTWVEEKMKMWADAFKGANNANSTAFIPAEIDYKQFDRKMPEHQQALSDDQISEICAAFRVPVDMVKTAASKDPLGGGGKMDSSRAMFYEDFVEPECEDIDTYINDEILVWLMPNSGATFSFDYDETRSLINDTKERSDKVRAEFDGSAITLNEMRIALDYEPLPGGDVIKFAPGTILVSKDNLGAAPALLAPPPPMPPAPPALPLPPVAPPQLPANVPQQATKSAAVMLNIGNHPDLIGLQNKTRSYVGDTPVKWSDPNSFHVTLATMPTVTDGQMSDLQDALKDVDIPDMALKVGSLGTFDNLDSHAVHFKVRKSVDLLDLQQQVHDTIDGLGIPMSSFSAPEAYKPHITMGYADSKPPARTFDSKLTVKPTALHLGVGDDIVYSKPIGDVVTPSEPPTPPSNQPPEDVKPIKAAPETTHASIAATISDSLGGSQTITATVVNPALKPVAIYAKSPEDELSQWEKKVKNKGVKSALSFQNYLIRDEIADSLRAALAVPEADTKAIFDAVKVALSIKAIQATRLDFENAFEDLLKAALADDVSRRKFGAGLKQLIKVYGFKAFVDGLRDGGIDDDPSDEEQAVIDDMVREQNDYVSGLGEAIFKDESVSEVMASGKPAMWFGKSVEPFYNKALVMANGNQLLEMTGDDGVKSCFQCSTLKGQRHRAKDWEAKKLWPKQDTENYDCGGFECVHGLTPCAGKARGNWLGAAKSEGGHEHTHEDAA